MDNLIYLGKVNLYWILLYACYWLMLRNHTFFRWNRAYLVGSLLIAFALPLIIYPASAPVLIQYEVTAETFTLAAAEVPEEPFMTWTEMVWLLYGVGFVIAAIYLIRHTIQLRKFLKAGEVIELDDCKIVLIDSDHIGSFSFLKWIVINRSDYENHFDAILRHEMVHTQQWHSLDILFIEVLKVVFWFNPFLLLYKRSFQEVHEFLADEQAPNRENYARFLVAYALNAPVASLTNHFFKPSQIKGRIKMIYKNRTSKWLLSTYAIAVTVIGIAALIVAGCEQKEDSAVAESEKHDQGKVAKVVGNKPIFSVVEVQPEFPGGAAEMYKFLGKKIKYPTAALKANASGRVFLSFIVTDEGNTSDIQVLKGIGYGCDEEAIRVLKKFPQWKPGKQNGQAVNVRYNLPINFEIEETGVKKDDAGSGLTSKKAPKNKTWMDADGKITEAAVVAFVDRPNLTFTNSAPEPSLAKVTFKSNSSLNSPLVYIDGVKQEKRGQAAFADIDPDNIKAISVLKNESAVSAYGEEGREGVVIITTKK